MSSGRTDGAGLQAFVIVTSRVPLPPLKEWLQAVGELPWEKTLAEGARCYDGNEFGTYAERGEARPVADLPKPLEAACRALHSRLRPGVDAIEVIAFPVKARPDSDGRAPLPPGAFTPGAVQPSESTIVNGPRRVLPPRADFGAHPGGWLRSGKTAIARRRLTQEAGSRGDAETRRRS
jgi:hypothetical protein